MDQLKQRQIRPLSEGSSPNLSDSSPVPSNLAFEIDEAASDSLDEVGVNHGVNQAGAGDGPAPPQTKEVASVPTPVVSSGERTTASEAKPGEGPESDLIIPDPFPQEKGLDSDLALSQLANSSGELSASSLAPVPSLPDEPAASADQSAEPSPVDQLLSRDAKSTGGIRVGPGSKVGHPLPTSEDIHKRASAAEYAKEYRDRVKEHGSALTSLAHSVNPADDPGKAEDETLLKIRSVQSPEVIAKKLKRFAKLFYLNPLYWDSRTLKYILKAYRAGVPLKTILDKVSSPSASFSDGNGNLIPTFRNLNAEIGNLRLVDLNALLATCIFQTLNSQGGMIACLDGSKSMGIAGIGSTGEPSGRIPTVKIEGLPGVRQRRLDGEITPTTFVDMIFFDYLYPGQLGHSGVLKFVEMYEETTPTQAAVRKIYDSLLTPFRHRWKAQMGIAKKKPFFPKSTNTRSVQQFDEALAYRTAFLNWDGRLFLLTEWKGDLPESLPQFAANEGSRKLHEAQPFLARMAQHFDSSLPFDETTRDSIAAS